MLHVEIVVLDEGKHFSGQFDQAIERLAILVRRQQRLVLGRYPRPLLQNLRQRAANSFAATERLDIAANRGEGQTQIVHPHRVGVRIADSRRKPEPRILRILQRLKPLRASFRAADRSQHLVGRAVTQESVGEVELDRQFREAPQFVVRPEQQDVDPRDHAGDRLVGDAGKRLLTELAESQIGAIAEVQHLEMVGAHLEQIFDQPVV